MRKFHFYGHLAETFPEPVELEVDTALEGIRAIGLQMPEFLDLLKDGEYRVVRGDLDDGLDLDIEGVIAFRLGQGDVHIVPVIAGAGGGGGDTGSWIKIIAGVALVGAAIFFSGGVLATAIPGTFGMISYGTVAFIGVALALYGAYQLLAKPEENEEQESYSISGPMNTYTQGGPVPLVYGEVMTGSVTLSAGTEYGEATEALPSYAVITYNWSSADGTDLDTTTTITAPFTSASVGWGPNNSSVSAGGQLAMFWYSGDNTSNTGPENVTINLNAIRAAYPSAENVTLTLYGNWYATRLNGDTVVSIATYSGGTLDSTTLTPTTAGSLKSLESFAKNIASISSTRTPGNYIATVTITLATGEIAIAGL